MCANALTTKVGFYRNLTEFKVFEKCVNKNRENSKLIEFLLFVKVLINSKSSTLMFLLTRLVKYFNACQIYRHKN